MARQKKDAKPSTFYLALEIVDKLEEYCRNTGLSKTVAVERFIEKGIIEYESSNRISVLVNERDK